MRGNPALNPILRDNLPFSDYRRCAEFLQDPDNNFEAQRYVLDRTDTYAKGSTKFVNSMVRLLCSNSFRKLYFFPVVNR